jgi:hypothetical protein
VRHLAEQRQGVDVVVGQRDSSERLRLKLVPVLVRQPADIWRRAEAEMAEALAEARAEHGVEDGRHERHRLGRHEQLHLALVVVGELEDDVASGVNFDHRRDVGCMVVVH